MSSEIDMHTIIVQALKERGWAYMGPAVGLKSFETVVGIKQAEAHLSRGDGLNRTLMGTYHSEGRNCLSNCGVLMPLDADADTVRRLTHQFADNVDVAVAESYAANLHNCSKMALALEKAGYKIGARDPKVKPEFQGAFMITDPLDDDQGYAIVGDDRLELIQEAHSHLGFAEVTT